MQNEGIIYIVSTPIGNLEDISFRAVKILEDVDIILAENTKNTKKLLNHYQIKTKLSSYHEHNEDIKSDEIVDKIKTENITIALVSDAGTPLISDPGYKLINKAISQNIKIVPISGASASLAALCASGIACSSFSFIGFLAKRQNQRIKKLQELKDRKDALIFYESPKRILKFLEEIKEQMGNRNISIAREITKLFEEFIRGDIDFVIEELKKKKTIKGEFTIVVEGFKDGLLNGKLLDEGDLIKIIKKKIKNKKASPSLLAKEIAQELKVEKKIVYNQIINLQKTT